MKRHFTLEEKSIDEFNRLAEAVGLPKLSHHGDRAKQRRKQGYFSMSDHIQYESLPQLVAEAKDS